MSEDYFGQGAQSLDEQVAAHMLNAEIAGELQQSYTDGVAEGIEAERARYQPLLDAFDAWKAKHVSGKAILTVIASIEMMEDLRGVFAARDKLRKDG